MKRRATTQLESKRLISPPGLKISVAFAELEATIPKDKEYYSSNDSETVEDDEMFSDYKMSFLPSASSIKQLLGFPSPRSVNIMEWIADEAPTDIVPQILSFVGSRKLVALSLLNSKWRSIVLTEATWRTVCEDTGKWQEGDPLPCSWLELYRNSPCVPIDYNTIKSAFAAVTSDEGSQHKTVRILLHPARYELSEPLVVHASGLAQVTIKSLDVAPRVMHRSKISASAACSSRLSLTSGSSNCCRKLSPTKQLSKRLGYMRRNFMRSCLSITTMTNGSDAVNNVLALEQENDATLVAQIPGILCLGMEEPFERLPSRAELTFKTRKANKPLIHVQKGTLNLSNVDLVHYAAGTDIWNGNTAVQVQPRFGLEGEILPIISPDRPPVAFLTNVDIKSESGRGVVAIDGGNTVVKQCRIHHCAATGLYVGGPGSEATIEQSDVIQNGNGNQLSPRGIARGHSGVYVEQGYARVIDSNISNNALTGISAVSRENAVLHVENCDVIGNGTLQLEWPQLGSRSYSMSINRNNITRQRGNGRLRSGLHLVSDKSLSDIAALTRNQNEPQSPRNNAAR